MFAAGSKVVPAPISAALYAEPLFSWKQIIEPVEPFLEAVSRRLAQQVETFHPEIAPYADYALNGQGKHLRPALVALTANALGKAAESHVTVALIIEMVHLATLVHDDVMDEAEIRRGRLTLAASCGNETAVLFWDCLFAQALKLASSCRAWAKRQSPKRTAVSLPQLAARVRRPRRISASSMTSSWTSVARCTISMIKATVTWESLAFPRA